MTDQIRYEYLADDSEVTKALERQQKENLKLERIIEKLAKKSKDAANSQVGSYAAIEKELKDNEDALRRMTVGTDQFAQQKAKVDQLRSALQGAKTELLGNAAVARQSGTVVSQFVAKIGGIAAGLISIRTITQTIRAELEKLRSLRLDASAQERTFQESLAAIGQNIGGDKIGEARRLIEVNAPLLKTTPEGLANLLGLAISADAKDLQEALAVSQAALEVTVGDANKAAELVGSSLDLTRAAGSDDFRAAIGQLLQAQSQVRATDLSEFASNIGPALAAATADRANQDALTTERTLEVAAVFSKLLSDRQGSVTGTGLRQFIARLDAFQPKLEATLEDGTKVSTTQEVLDQFKAARSFDERINLLRANPALQRQFLDEQKESQAKIAIDEFTRGTKRALEAEGSAAEAITSLDDAVSAFETLRKGIADNTQQLGAVREAEANIQVRQQAGERAGEGTAAEILQRTFDSVDLPGADAITRRVSDLEFEFAVNRGQDPNLAAAEILRDIRDDLKQGFGGGVTQPGFRFGAEDREDLALLQKQIDLLERMANRQDQNDRPVQQPVAAEGAQ